MLIMVMTLTAFAVVREREIGTLEQIMVTPIRRWEFIVGQNRPVFPDRLLRHSPAGTNRLFLVRRAISRTRDRADVGCHDFPAGALGLGLLISTISPRSNRPWSVAFFFILPAVTLSGFGTPISSMPHLFQEISYFNPLTHVILILRSVYLKGVGLEVLWPNVLYLAGFSLLMFAVAVLRFRKSLD